MSPLNPFETDSMSFFSPRDYSRLEPTLFSRNRMSSLRVLVAGAGALGNEAIKNLALLGVGGVFIADYDTIERSNLTRSILFCTPDIDKYLQENTPKASLAAKRVNEINPDVKAVSLVCEVADLGLGVLRRMDLILGCLDNEMARLELSWACNRVDRPLIDAGLGVANYSSGMISIFPGANGPCYACRKGKQGRRELLQDLHGAEDPCWMKERRAQESGFVSTTPFMASIVAGIQVEMGLRHCFSESASEPEQGRAIKVSLDPNPVLEEFDFGRSSGCPLHESESLVNNVVQLRDARSPEITVSQLLSEAGCEDKGSSLCLDWPITAEAKCLDCRHIWRPMTRRARFRNRGRCLACSSRNLVELQMITSIEAFSELASWKLTELGLPTLHIHEVAQDNSTEKVHLEISGDLVDLPLGELAWV